VINSLTSIVITKTWLKNSPRARQVSGSGRRLRRVRKCEIILGKPDHKISIVMQTGTLDRGACAELSGRIGPQNVEG
jgi:hypothetical protein